GRRGCDGAFQGRVPAGAGRRRARGERLPFGVDRDPRTQALSSRRGHRDAAARRGGGRFAPGRSRATGAIDMSAGIDFLTALERVIAARLADASAEQSYTARLVQQGIVKVAQKVGEEGVELALAAAAQDDARVTSEAADLLYHVIVLLRARGLRLEDVVGELERRHR